MDEFCGFLEALAKIDLKLEDEEMNIEKREARFASVALLLGSGYLWLARDLDGSIAAYSHKPFKSYAECWCLKEGETKAMWMWVDDGDLYNFVKWEDEEPVNIREWLEKEEEEMKMYSVKDGELECREVDADFFEKNTTLGGLLTSDEVELDRDNRIVTDGVTGTVQIMSDNKIFMEGPYSEYARFPFLTSVDLQPNTGQDYDETDWYETENVQIHGKVCQELTETYKKKNADYGNSFENSLDKHGMIAGIVRMDDKMSRLISLNSKNEQQVLDESLRDTLMDLANYAIMSVMWLDEQ